MADAVYCRECGKEIIFIRTRSGASMPCNPRPEWFWADPAGPVLIYQRDGSCQKARLTGLDSTRTGSGYVPHWSSCPAQREMRKKREARRQHETELERVIRERVERESAARAEREEKAAERRALLDKQRAAEAAQFKLEGF